VQRYILENENKDLRDLILKNKVILGIPTAQLIEQIGTRKKAKEKLPLYYQTPGIIFPPPASFEQSSSEATASFKSELIARFINGKSTRGADLTGGFGVDTYFLSKRFGKIHYVEPQAALMEIARYNHQLLGANNIEYHAMTADNFLATTGSSFDFVYVDPSRRTIDRKKVYALEDSQPDILNLKTEIFKRTSLMVVKASPLLDIQAGMAQLASVKKVFAVSVNNDCKELLFFCEKGFEGTAVITAVNIPEGHTPQMFEFSFPEERAQKVEVSDPLRYLYEPNASILKAGAFKSAAARFNLKKIHVNTHLYTGEHLVDNFPGRKFLIEELVKPSTLKKYFPDGKANVTTRNYPLTPEALKKKTGLKDGGEKFLIGFSGEKKKFLAVARRLPD
jgi:16S rRNA G966 N2-methylase RsmD